MRSIIQIFTISLCLTLLGSSVFAASLEGGGKQCKRISIPPKGVVTNGDPYQGNCYCDYGTNEEIRGNYCGPNENLQHGVKQILLEKGPCDWENQEHFTRDCKPQENFCCPPDPTKSKVRF
jgi:hypothetical protein